MPLESETYIKNADVVPGNLADMYRDHLLTDLALCVQGRCFPVHKVVVAAGSPYFLALLTNDMSEGQAASLDVNDVSEDIFEQVLSFMYRGEAKLNGFSFAAQLLAVADRFLMSDLAHMTLQAVKQHATVGDYPELLVEGQRLFIQDLEAFAFARCCQHFTELRSLGALLDLPFATMMELLRSRFLVIEHELQVLDVALSWLERNCRETADDSAMELVPQVVGAIHFWDINPASLPDFWPRLAPYCSGVLTCRFILCGLGRAGSPGGDLAVKPSKTETASRWLLHRVAGERESQELAHQLVDFATERPERGHLGAELLALRKDATIKNAVLNMMQQRFDAEAARTQSRSSSIPRCGEFLCLADFMTSLIGRDMLACTVIQNHVLPALARANSDTGWLLLCTLRHGVLQKWEQRALNSRAALKAVIDKLREVLEDELNTTNSPWLRLELRQAIEDIRARCG